MSGFATIALAGLGAAQTRLQASAHNIANAQTPGLRRLQVTQAEVADGGVQVRVERGQPGAGSMTADVLEQLQAKNVLLANLAVFRAGDRMAGTLLDALA